MLPATGRQHRECIIPQAVTHSLVLLKMGKIISRNMLNWLELLISRYCCIYLVVYIIYIALFFLRPAKQSQFKYCSLWYRPATYMVGRSNLQLEICSEFWKIWDSILKKINAKIIPIVSFYFSINTLGVTSHAQRNVVYCSPSFGRFPGAWILYADVSEHSVPSSYAV